MHNNNDDPLIIYTSPKIRDWKCLRSLIENTFPEITRRDMSHLIRNGMNKMFVARREQQLLGFCYFEDFSHNRLHLLWLATDRNYYQRGVASQLLKHLDRYATGKGYKSIAVTIYNNNLAAKRLYKKLGYILTKDREAENKESWEKTLNSECTGPAIKFGFWARNYYPFRVFRKILYRYLAN